MYIEQFVYLKAISQTGSLRAASEQVFVTEQAMSSAIRKLEKECGEESTDPWCAVTAIREYR